MREFEKGEMVCVLDYPFGKPSKVLGKVVGLLPNGYYNILVKKGWNEDKIIGYKYWKLTPLT